MFILALDSLEDLETIIEARPDAIVLGIEPFCARTRAVTDWNQLPALVRRMYEAGIQVYINLLAMIEQSRLQACTEAFGQLAKMGVDGLYVADDGWLEIAYAYNPETLSLLIVQPETLLCSGEDASFFARQGTQAQSLSHELSEAELIACIKTCPSCELLCAGHYSWMESRRGLLSNYLHQIEKPEDFQEGRLYTLREMNRHGRMPVWQDHLGTHVLSDEVFQAGEYLLPLREAGLQRYRIDCLLMGNTWGLDMLKAYRTLLTEGTDALSPKQKEEISSTIWKSSSLIRKEKSHGTR